MRRAERLLFLFVSFRRFFFLRRSLFSSSVRVRVRWSSVSRLTERDRGATRGAAIFVRSRARPVGGDGLPPRYGYRAILRLTRARATGCDDRRLPASLCRRRRRPNETTPEATACMLADRGTAPEAAGRPALLARLMELPNATWAQLMAQAKASLPSLLQPDAVREVTKVVKTNVRVCSAVGPLYVSQLGTCYLDLLNVYKVTVTTYSCSVSLSFEHNERRCEIDGDERPPSRRQLLVIGLPSIAACVLRFGVQRVCRRSRRVCCDRARGSAPRAMRERLRRRGRRAAAFALSFPSRALARALHASRRGGITSGGRKSLVPPRPAAQFIPPRPTRTAVSRGPEALAGACGAPRERLPHSAARFPPAPPPPSARRASRATRTPTAGLSLCDAVRFERRAARRDATPRPPRRRRSLDTRAR